LLLWHSTEKIKHILVGVARISDVTNMGLMSSVQVAHVELDHDKIASTLVEALTQKDRNQALFIAIEKLIVLFPLLTGIYFTSSRVLVTCVVLV
jgi:hypothetical protein